MTTTTGTPTSSDVTIDELRERERAKWRSARRNDKLQRGALGLGLPVVLLALWQFASASGVVDERFFPAPLTIVQRAANDIMHNGLLQRIGAEFAVSMGRIALGLVIGVVGGILIGTALGTVKRLRYALGPFVYAVYPMPKLAILPLLLILFGIGNASKVTLVALGVFFVVCISTLSGTLYTSQMYRDVAQTFSLPRLMRYRYVTLPAAMPSIMNGVKLGIGQALILCVSVEFVSSDDGIGAFIWSSWQTFSIPSMFVGLFVIAAAGALAVLAGDLLERKLIPWANVR